ncbi:Brix domain-containing protein [Sphaerosporella brunnea]|uniref:Brix domain-containing protein n=1 Tax=Sphaerosporella brunnea TaxID=1250544 RepID=A0A5J5ENI0_9PEZI|nr:Brix domain-containing protein [Sphaerosporella brunnea]
MSTLFKAVTTPSHEKPEKVAPKSRVLILSSRGVTYRHRHLLNDLVAMLPHSRKDAKLDTKSQLHYLNEVAELYNCNGVLFFEARKRQDLYLWLARNPNGPSIKFHIQNLHTMSELNFTGNALRGSRPIVSFDKNFDATPSAALMKELLLHTFSVPKGTRKSKPFVDRVVAFTLADGKVWLRHYQVQITSAAAAGAAAAAGDDDEDTEKKSRKDSKDGVELVEIGPRFVMTPIVILEGSFGGPVVYENKEFVSPNEVRAAIREKRAVRAGGRDMARTKRVVKKREIQKEQKIAKMAEAEIDDAVLFA